MGRRHQGRKREEARTGGGFRLFDSKNSCHMVLVKMIFLSRSGLCGCSWCGGCREEGNKKPSGAGRDGVRTGDGGGIPNICGSKMPWQI